MKTTFTTQHNAASTLQGSHSTHNVYSPLRRLTLLVTLLMTFALGARAADYVITYTNGGTTYYLGMNGNNLQAKTTFDITCVWTCLNGNTEANLGNNSRSLRNRNNSSYYLTTSCTRSGSRPYTYTWEALRVQATASNIWRSSNGNVYARISSADNRQASINVQSLTMIDNNTNSSKNVQVTITDISTTSTNPTINGDNFLTAIDNYTYTASGAAYQAGGYSNYRFNNTDHYFDNNNTAITPTAATLNTTWSITANEFATINSSGVVTVNSIPTSDVTLTITATVSVTDGIPAVPDGTTLVGTKEIIIQGSVPAAPTISVSGTAVTLQTDATGTTSIRYTIDGTDPTATTGTEYNGAFDISGSTNSPVTIKAITVRNGNASSVTTQQVKLTLPEPTITVDGAAGTATITCSNSSATIHYTTDGSAPSATNGTRYNGQITGLTTMATVKAIAICDGWNSSSVASATVTIPSGVSPEGTVTLFDLEDHNWTYYQSSNLPTGYPTSYLSSPNPRNVKITYNGVNGVSGSSTNVKVSISESENSFVYYKTLEQGSTSGEYPYQVISNPFSVRPSTGSGNSKVYYGFSGWKIKSGGDYIKNYDNDDILPLDAEIIFEKLPYPSVNCISAEIVLETTWTKANVQTGNDISRMLNQFSGGTYETNFAVLTGSYTTAWTGNKNATITSVYPDGSTDSRDEVSTRLNLTLNDGYTIKYEYIHINNSNSTFTMGSGTKMLYLGRGISNTTAGNSCCNLLQGCSGNVNNGLTYTLKIESGIYGNISYTRGLNSSQDATIKGTVDIKSILGCDYDRAKKDNEKLKFTNEMWVGDGPTLSDSKSGQTIWRCTVKSGTMNSSLTSAGNGDAQRSFYVGIGANYSPGHRRLEVEGGLFWSIAGGLDKNNNTDPCITYRIRGGTFRGAIYGSAANASAYGIKQMIFTGGEIQGWIGAGANGTSNNGGKTDGTSYVYIGGKTRLVGNNETLINGSVGGSVFGAGSGSPDYTAGEMTLGSNVVVADEAYIVKNVYGGGNYGFTDNQANIFITGGTVDGGVFGGANQNKGDYTNVVMTGGLVKGGIYGGSNTSGTIGYNVTMQINGGQVGTSSKPANIHGGGYGQSTIVTGNVNLTLGTSDQTSEGVTVWGDVYGGSALGKVNCTVNNYNNYQYTNNTETNVTLYKGTINGSLYGGALGGSNVGTHVYGPVKVKVYGGSVKKTSADGSGGVYGANNKDGAPQRSVTVDIYGTDPTPAEGQYALYAVYGGGNQAPYTYGNGYPKVTVHNCDNSIEYVYGGGNAAAVAATDVTIWGGNVIGNVFGGGNGTVSAANVTGNTSTKIYGGTILNVYGGSNSQGTIDGTISVLVDSQGEDEKEPCTMNIGSVYGGGNLAASRSGNIDINCTGENGYIENVFGGANRADITGNIDLHIDGGNIGNVFGGNNNSGDINGTITVTVGNEPNYCGVFRIGNVYGGGNLAAYSAPTGNPNFPMVNIEGGTVLNAVYGGGLGESAVVTGNPRVNVSGGTVGNKTTMVGATMITGDVFGGGSQAALTGNAIVTLSDNANVYNCVYGGGLGEKAIVTGNTQVKMTGGTVGYAETVDGKTIVRSGDVFGGGNAAAVVGNTNVYISGGEVKHNVYGGGNQAKVTGKTNVVIGE